MDLYYNPDRKLAFLATRNEAQQRNIKNLFRKSRKREAELGKDLFAFQMEEFQQLFNDNEWDTNYGTLKERVGLVRIYLDWCVKQEIETGINPALLLTKDLRTERTRTSAELSEYYGSYEDFMNEVNRIFNASGILPESGKVCKLFCALCFLSFKVNEIGQMRFSDLDLENGIFRLPKGIRETGETYQVVSKAVAELARECNRQYEDLFHMQHDFKVITDVTRRTYIDKPAENPAWTTKKYWKLGTDALKQQGKEDAPESFKHYTISMSGQYSRIYEEVGDDIRNYSDEIAKKYVRSKSFARTKRFETLAGYKKWVAYFHGEPANTL